MSRMSMVVLAAALGSLVVILMGAGDGAPAKNKKVAPDKQRSVIVDPAEHAAAVPAAKVWIGVRLSPTPEALNAHLGHGGLMIANVVADSPTDKAGIERYDVVVSVNAKDVAEMGDLINAIVENGTGKPAQLKVLRGGKERTISVTPVERPKDFAMNFKYDDPQSQEASPDVQYFGHRFQRDPSGNWIFEPLGKLPGLPDDVKDSLNDLTNPAWNAWQDAWKGMQIDPFRMRTQPDSDDPDSFLFFYPDGGDENAQVEISITATENGETIAIHRAADGSVTVDRTDADGKRSTAKYDNMDDLKANDADAYKTYRRFSGYRSRPMITMPPDAKSLAPMQRDFQEKIQKAIEKARQQTERALKDAGQVRERIQMRNESRSSSSGGKSTAESVTLTVENGHIKLKVTHDNDTKEYEFDSRAEFQKAEPELYKKYESLLGDVEGGERSQSSMMMLAAMS